MLLAIIALLIVGGGIYIYETSKAEKQLAASNEAQLNNQKQPVAVQHQPITGSQNNSGSNVPVANTNSQEPATVQNQQTNNQSQPVTPSQNNSSSNSITANNPQISLLSSVTTPIGSTIIIQGTNLNPIVDKKSIGAGWLTHSHVFVNIKNVNTGKTAILWEDLSVDSGVRASISNKISAVLSQSLCTYSEAGAGGCDPNGYMAITPGLYLLSVSVDGRGLSNAINLTITNSSAPVICQSNSDCAYYIDDVAHGGAHCDAVSYAKTCSACGKLKVANEEFYCTCQNNRCVDVAKNCGDGICESGESMANCAKDCAKNAPCIQENWRIDPCQNQQCCSGLVAQNATPTAVGGMGTVDVGNSVYVCGKPSCSILCSKPDCSDITGNGTAVGGNPVYRCGKPYCNIGVCAVDYTNDTSACNSQIKQ